MDDLAHFLLGASVIGLLILANAFFVAAEFALVAVRRTRVEHLAQEGVWLAGLLRRALDQLDLYIAACQLGITMASLGLGWAGEPFLARLLDPLFLALLGHRLDGAALHALSFTLAFAFITLLHVILGELAPKGLALQMAERVAFWVILPLHAFLLLFRPLIAVMNGLGNLVLRFFRLESASTHTLVGSPEELKLLVEASSRQGVLDREEGELIQHILELEETPVREIMTPRVDMVAIEAEATLEDFLHLFREHRYSRVPVYRESVDHIVGVAYAQDLLDYACDGLVARTVASIAHPAYFVPENMDAWTLLKELRRRKVHMAIVVDEFGGTAGLVTLEDVMEEIVGEIYDETDEPEDQPIKRLPDGSFSIQAQTPVDEVSEALGVELPEGEYDTLSGFLYELFGRIPGVGESVEWQGFRFLVESADQRRIERVRVERLVEHGEGQDQGLA
ncbi:hemolysin family protein [Thermus islandicus]|uniref:hemolysin family protein n=1 Tax=Thermus islandicus TaxID=540988 RepID=UPI0003B3DA8B|nr:hemolysin family protein [Thermus islandicus]